MRGAGPSRSPAEGSSAGGVAGLVGVATVDARSAAAAGCPSSMSLAVSAAARKHCSRRSAFSITEQLSTIRHRPRSLGGTSSQWEGAAETLPASAKSGRAKSERRVLFGQRPPLAGVRTKAMDWPTA